MKPTTIVGVKISDYAGIENMGNRVVASLTGNPSFTTPVPALATVSTDITALETAISNWGPVHNRGSHADLLALRDAARTVYNDLLSLAQYVQTTAQVAAGSDYTAMAAIIGTSGFGIKNPPMPQGLLGSPQNLHRMFQNSVSLYTPKLKYKKPIGLTSPNNVKSYQILRNTVNNILTATVIGTSTKTSFIDVTAAAGTQYYYWVKGVNSAGPGAESAVLQTSTPV
jgi:predicted phage tail protein